MAIAESSFIGKHIPLSKNDDMYQRTLAQYLAMPVLKSTLNEKALRETQTLCCSKVRTPPAHLPVTDRTDYNTLRRS